MFEFFHRNFDKLILLFLVVFFTAIALHIIHDMPDSDSVNWSTSLVSGALGSLLTLITGNLLKSSRNPDNPVKPEGEQ